MVTTANKQGFREYLIKKYGINSNISVDIMIRETATIWIYKFFLTGKQAEEAWDNVYGKMRTQDD